MRKVLFYLDAENLAVTEVQATINNVKADLQSDELLIGKFYGNRSVLTNIMRVCYEEGLEFVETSSILSGHKNVTDMKIVIDCVFDTFIAWKNEVSRVILVSKDQDFTPLIYKLKGNSVLVEAPLFDATQRITTLADVAIALKDAGYDPLTDRKTVFYNQFQSIRKLLSDDFSDELILSYLKRKQLNFLKAIRLICDEDILASLREVNPIEFSFYLVKGLCKWEPESLQKAINEYTSKFFGLQFNDRELAEVVLEV